MFEVGGLFLLSIAGQGRSGESDVPERDEEILADEIGQIRGWRERDDREMSPSPSCIEG